MKFLDRRNRDGGSASIEALAVAPAIFLLINLAAAAGQIAYAKSIVQEEAQRVARVMSEARTQADANNYMLSASSSYVNSGNYFAMCANTTTPASWTFGNVFDPTVNTVPGKGAPSIFEVTVYCSIKPRYLPFALPPITVTATAYTSLDPYKNHGVAAGSG